MTTVNLNNFKSWLIFLISAQHAACLRSARFLMCLGLSTIIFFYDVVWAACCSVLLVSDLCLRFFNGLAIHWSFLWCWMDYLSSFIIIEAISCFCFAVQRCRLHAPTYISFLFSLPISCCHALKLLWGCEQSESDIPTQWFWALILHIITVHH
jgi:hypothetical protein